MKKFIAIFIILISLMGCSKKEDAITFNATIDEVNSSSIMVTTKDYDGFDKASVTISEVDKDFDLSVGQNIELTILPEVKESYPVKATATKVVLKKSDYRKLTSDEANEIINNNEYGVILDVRTAEEYNEGHIENSTLLSSNEIEDKAEITLYDKNEVILVYCRSGNRSEDASKKLLDMGYTNVYDFGGIISWPYDIVK